MQECLCFSANFELTSPKRSLDSTRRAEYINVPCSQRIDLCLRGEAFCVRSIQAATTASSRETQHHHGKKVTEPCARATVAELRVKL